MRPSSQIDLESSSTNSSFPISSSRSISRLCKACDCLDKYILFFYIIFNVWLFLCFMTKHISFPKIMLLWIISSFALLWVKFLKFLQSYQQNQTFPAPEIERRSFLDRISRENPALRHFFRNGDEFMEIFAEHDINNLTRFPEYNTVFSNILRLRVQVFLMRMSIMALSNESLPSLEHENTNNLGLDSNDLDILPYEVFVKKENEIDCTICLESVKEGEYIRYLKCGHGFHKDCIDKWLLLQRICPYCRDIVQTV